ncbi:gliding motility lipoprotein GldB [Sunxiuqinia sp. A32]|uniref:gliding motility lipoprotein GldB n=1 Tax=Sunxiuqinia sp. A32 TaxID=3461496 RepID=UPI004045A1EE
MNRFLLILCLLIIFISCNRNPLKVNTSNVELQLQFKSLDEDLFEAQDNLEIELPKIQKSYGDFFTIFTHQMINIGGPDNDEFYMRLESFLKDLVIVGAKKLSDETIDKKKLESTFLNALKHYKYYFPEKSIPQIYTCISGFNQSIVLTENLIGVSLDKYLGEDCEFYPQLGIPKYKIQNMHQGKIVSDAMYAWALTDYPIKDDADKLIEHMVYQGKLLYFVDAMLPELDDTVKIGYSKEQLDFCELSEQGMWTYLAEQKMLFSTQRMDIKRYIDDAPYTSSFTADSPGRVGMWFGWKIVKAYMKKNPKVTISQLMENDDYLGILNQSGYQPD